MPIRNCLNCNNDITPGDVYCSNCGQKASEPQLSVKALVANFFSNVFNLDSKFINSFISLFVPGRYTIDFVAGKRVKYYSPGRVMFVSMVIFFFLLATVISRMGQTDRWGKINEEAWRAKMEIKYDSIVRFYEDESQSSSIIQDSIKAALFEKVDTNKTIHFTSSDKDTSGIDFEIFDLLNMPEEEFFTKNKINNKNTQFILRQLKKSAKDVKGTVNFMIGNLSWMFLLMALSLAALMKLLYIRRRHYYAEHLIFQMHFMSFGIVMGSIFLIITLFKKEFDQNIFIGFTLLSAIYLFIALKRYYQQGFLKTTIKYIILLFGYLFSFVTFVLLISAVSFLLF